MSKTTITDFKKRAVRHGECLLFPITDLPQHAVCVYEGKEFIVAKSESHHHHVAVGEVRVFRSGENFFLEAVRDSRIEHRKTFEKHETKPIFKGLYQIVIKKAYDYFLKRQTNVMD